MKADLNRVTSSGGAFGHYDWLPTGSYFIPPVGPFPTVGWVTVGLVTGLRNTLVIEKSLGGVTMQLLFDQDKQYFDVNLSLDGSISAYGIDLSSIRITRNSVSVSIGDEEFTYTKGNTGTLVADLVEFGVPQTAAEEIVSAIDTVFSQTDAIENWIEEERNKLDSTDYSEQESAVTVDLTSNTATSEANGTPVDIGEIVHVMATNYDDEISGDDQSNTLEGGDGKDQLDGVGGGDTLRGMEGNDVIAGGDTAAQGGSVEADRIEGGSGNDTISIHAGEAYGQADNDAITILGNGATGSRVRTH